MALKKSELISDNIIVNHVLKPCECCGEIMKTRESIVSLEFHKRARRIYVHFKCKDIFIDKLK